MNARPPSAVMEIEWAPVLAAYRDAAERLRDSHERLQGEVRRLREELTHKNEELRRRERLAALGQMAAGLAHEVRNPLGGIALQASLLERELRDRPQAVSKAASIRDGVRALDRLVSDVLCFAQEGRIVRECMRASDLAARLERAWLPTAVRRGVALRFAVPGDAAAVGDASKLERALGNLIQNAIEAAGSGGEVSVAVGVAGDHLEWRVSDNGPGIPGAALCRIFDPFYTTKPEGTGLGLSIVHQIAEAHGGCVRVDSRPGQGTTFVLSLPAGQAEGVTDGDGMRAG